MNKLFKTAKSNAIAFSENFATNFTPGANSTWYNISNNWRWISYCSGNVSAVNVSSSKFYGDTGGTGSNNYCAKMCRTLEGYNTTRSFDMQYSFILYQAATPYNTEWASVSIGGNNSTLALFETIGGLEFRVSNGVNNSATFNVLNNGSVIGTPYTGLSRDTNYYAFIQKRGLSVGVTINTTGVKPSSPAYTYTMTNTTSASNSLILYIAGQGSSSYGGQSSISGLSTLLF